MLGFKPKKDEVLNHWIGFADSFQLSSNEFYEGVERAISARKIPGLEMTRVEYAEGGFLSDERVYLRMIRERLAFDTCAAPFGTGCFFSCRTVYSPPVVRLSHLVIAAVFFLLVYYPLLHFLGLFLGTFALALALTILGYICRNAAAMGLSDLDGMLLKVPGIGPIYERWFRKETYYRLDTRLMYLVLVPKIIQDLAMEITGTKGVKLSRQFERAPVLGELYKPVPPRPATKVE